MFRYTDIALTFRGHLRQPRAKATAKQDGIRSQPVPLFPTSFESCAQDVVKYGLRDYGESLPRFVNVCLCPLAGVCSDREVACRLRLAEP